MRARGKREGKAKKESEEPFFAKKCSSGSSPKTLNIWVQEVVT
jgi:hypothetical protein